ncbi:hypothetical protein D3C78_1921170 [compost metagenome]
MPRATLGELPSKSTRIRPASTVTLACSVMGASYPSMTSVLRQVPWGHSAMAWRMARADCSMM